MRIALIIPKNGTESSRSFYDYRFYAEFLLSRKYISYLLAIPTLASLTPLHHEIRVFDENIEEIDYGWPADLAGISVRTMFAKRAYTIAARYRRLGVKTVLGGIHPSMCTEEALEHCDCVVAGEAEEVWGTLLKDAEEGTLKRLYSAGAHADLKASPATARDSLSRTRYLQDIVQTTKGCPYHCEFCSVYAFDGQKIRSRGIDTVLDEIRDITEHRPPYKKKNAIFFADDNIIADKRYARELFKALKPHNINWSCQASINLSREDEILGLMRDSGCGAVLIGFESISKKNLEAMHKQINQRFDYAEAVRKIQSFGIMVHSAFIVGYDFDSGTTFDELIAFLRETNLLMPLVNVLTPFPGTELFKRLEKEGRILHKDWDKYDAKHVVFRHPALLPGELKDGYMRVIRDAYSFDSIWRKLNYYWDRDFWKRANEADPVKFIYRLVFALRLITLLSVRNKERSRFIMKVLPRVFDSRVRVSTILTLMAYNDFAYGAQEDAAPEREAACGHAMDETVPLIPFADTAEDLQKPPVHTEG